MNLELLDPFRKPQLPDRVDVTLVLDDSLHQLSSTTTTTATGIPGGRRNSSHDNQNDDDNTDMEWKAAQTLQFNRRGTYLSVGYATGTVACFDFCSRTMSAIYPAGGKGSGIKMDNTKTTSTDATKKSENKRGGRRGSEKKKNKQTSNNTTTNNILKNPFPHGASHVSWSKSSRLMLVGSDADCKIRLIDTTHTYGPEECYVPPEGEELPDISNNLKLDLPKPFQIKPTTTTTSTIKGSKERQGQEEKDQAVSFLRIPRIIPVKRIDGSGSDGSSSLTVSSSSKRGDEGGASTTTGRKTKKQKREKTSSTKGKNKTTTPATPTTLMIDSTKNYGPYPLRYPIVQFEFDTPVGNSLQIHPREVTCGLALLQTGELVLFGVVVVAPNKDGNIHNDIFTQQPLAPQNRTTKKQSKEVQQHQPIVHVAKLDIPTNHEGSTSSSTTTKSSDITCAIWNPDKGDELFVTTQDGYIVGYHDMRKYLQENIMSNNNNTKGTTTKLQQQQPKVSFSHFIGHNFTVWDITICRNGKLMLFNCSDGCLRLYSIAEFYENKEEKDDDDNNERSFKPIRTFQDVVTKSKTTFVCCDISGDGEYIVGGCNECNNDGGSSSTNKYELYLWNATTGALLDRLTGVQVNISSIAFHPTRSMFLAVATSDGIVDIWGPRMDWTAFAPDFKALPRNVEYVEDEDEFDVVKEQGMSNSVQQEQESGSSSSSSSLMNIDNNDDDDVIVDVVTRDPITVYASDSEDEDDVFHFEVKVYNLMVERRGGNRQGAGNSSGRNSAITTNEQDNNKD